MIVLKPAKKDMGVIKMVEDHHPGICYACKEEKPVRWKNLYTIGSEGTDLCMPCEMKVVNLLRSLAREAALARKQKYLDKRRL